MNDSSKPISNRPSLKSILKLTAQIGISGSKIMLFVFFTFGFINLGWTIYAILRLFTLEFTWMNIGVLVLVVLLGVGFTLLACYFTYRYIILLSIKKVYDMTLEQRSKISEDIIRRVESTFKERAELSQAQLGMAVSWSQTVYRYYQAVPVFFQSGITQYLNRIPMTSFIIEVKEDIIVGNRSLAAEKLRGLMDNFFEEKILGSANNRLTWLLLLVDALVLYSLITWGIVASP